MELTDNNDTPPSTKEDEDHHNNKQEVILEVAAKSTGNDIPNGGLHAWMQVLGPFFLVFNSWGLVNSFGAYQTHYETVLLVSSTSSAISWIGTVQAFLLILVGIVSGPFYDRGYIRTLIILGTIMTVFGLMMTSLAFRYWEIFLAQGLGVGLGLGRLYVPSVAIISTYFSTKRALAVGLTSAGGSLGGIFYPIIFRRLQPSLGFDWATRIIAFIVLPTLLFSLAILRRRTIPGPPGALLEPTAFREIPFALFTMGFFFFLTGLYAPFFYVPIYAERIVGVSSDFSFYLLAIINAGSFVGRVLPPLVAHRLGPYNTLLPCLFMTGIIGFAWMSVHSVAGIVLFSIFYGFFSGAVLALPPTVMVALSPDVRFAGTRIGMSFGVSGLGVLVGNPIYGAIADIPKGDFVGAQGFAAAMMMAGSSLFLGARILRFRSHKDRMMRNGSTPGLIQRCSVHSNQKERKWYNSLNQIIQ
ncbi:MAG: hypothetical protein Q9221_006505 [Calogaya cf. arnoldii]